MPGFILSYGSLKRKIKYKQNNKELVCGVIHGENYSVQRKTLDRFIKDKIFHECSEYIIVLEGVILNKMELLKKGESWIQYILNSYHIHGETFFNHFRGSFSGIFFDKKKNRWIIFTDHIGSKHIYYSKLGYRNYIFASDINDIYELYKANNLGNNLDSNAAYMLLSYGYMLEGNTLSKEVKKLRPGSYVKIENEIFSEVEYYRFINIPDRSLTEDDAIELIDYHFRKSIDRQFQKDLEYGYKHFVALSGGLDSRMTAWVAHKMGYINQLNFTFSQTNYLDETIPKQIAAYLRHEWMFKALDNGLFLKDVEAISMITGGNVLYNGLAHGLSLFNYINFSNLGIVHTGQLGDVILGTYSSTPYHNSSYNLKSGSFSQKFINKVSFNNMMEYDNEELFKIYTRGFSGINFGLLGMQQYTETHSPFYDVDMMNEALTIPVEMRFNHTIYKKWILSKYPKAADFIWEKTRAKPSKKTINIKSKGKSIDIKRIPKAILQRLGIKSNPMSSKYHMNPLDYWFSTNDSLRNYFHQYFLDNIGKLDFDSNLKKDVVSLYNEGNATEKTQVISLLSSLKIYF